MTDRLAEPGLRDMAAVVSEPLDRTDLAGLSFGVWLALLVGRAAVERQLRALRRRLKKALLRRTDACVEDIDLSHPRGLDRSLAPG